MAQMGDIIKMLEELNTRGILVGLTLERLILSEAFQK